MRELSGVDCRMIAHQLAISSSTAAAVLNAAVDRKLAGVFSSPVAVSQQSRLTSPAAAAAAAAAGGAGAGGAGASSPTDLLLKMKGRDRYKS